MSERTGSSTVIGSAAPANHRVPYGLAWLAPAAGVTIGLAVLYGSVIRDLVTVWTTNSYYSYGVFVPLWSAWLAVNARPRVAAIRATVRSRRDPTGLLFATVGLVGLALGGIHDSLTLAVLSLPVVLTGLGWFALGREAFGPLAFPVAFLALMAPLPPAGIPFLSLHLQNLAAWITQGILTALAIPFARDGIFIHLRGATVHISEACNGLRFLLAMAVLGVAFGWTTGRGPACRVSIFGVAIAAALAANLVRVSATTVLVHVWGPAASTGLFHYAFGKTIYLATVAALFVLVLRVRAKP